MALLKNIFQEITVSNQSGADYSSLNTAIAAIGTIKSFRIESAITITADITFPSGCTLIIGTQGSLTGAFTLTGNNTVMRFEGINVAFATNVIFAGTWLCDKVTPEQFGALGDAVLNGDNSVTGTDDQTALTKMFAFAGLTREKKIVFGNKKTYYSTGAIFGANNLSIDGNFSTLLKDDSHVLTAAGTIGTYALLTANAYKNDSWLKCTDAPLLASLVPGDYIKLISTEICQPAAGENVAFGEIHLVRSIDSANGIIYLNENLHWNYLLTDDAQIAKITMTNFSLKNMKLWSISEVASAVALSLSYGLIDIQNVFIKGFTTGIQLSDCYKPYCNFTSWQADKDGIGYGIICTGATMYADISFLALGCRHAFTTGGGPGSGVTWGARVHDSIAFPSVVIASGPFDTHASSGSTYFDNCIVYGGLTSDLVASIVDWDDATTFHVNDIVRSITEFDLYKVTVENSNSDPEDIANYANWFAIPGNSATGFKGEGLYCYYNNCKAYGCAQGFFVYGVDMEVFSLTNCEVYDSQYGIHSNGTANVKDLKIDGIKHYNKNYMAGYGIYMQATYVNYVFRNIDTKNVVMFTHAVSSPSKIEISNFSSECDAPLVVFQTFHVAVKQVILSNGRAKGTGRLFYDQYDAGHSATELLMINNVTCEEPGSDVVYCGHPVDNVILNGLVASNPVAENYLISFIKSSGNLSMSNCAYLGANAKKIIYTDAAITLSKILHNNNLFPVLTDFRTGTGALAAIECVGGSLGADRVLRSVGTPEGAIIAPIGTLYLRNDGGANTSIYIKESGTGNTGWVAK